MAGRLRIDLPHLWLSQRRVGGAQAAYVRRGKVHLRVRAPDGTPLLPGDAGFADAYAALHRRLFAGEPKRAEPAAHSLAALIAAYQASEEFADLAPLTRQDYRRTMAAIEAAFGSKSVPEMPRAAVFTVRSHFATTAGKKPTPRRANKAVAALRLLMSWAVDHGWRPDNPALRPGRLRTGPGYRPWTREDVRRLLDHPEIQEPLKRAVALGYWTGMRLADCIALPKSARAGGVIEVTPGKTARSTRSRSSIPEHPDLTRWLDAAPASDAVTILTRGDGRPWRPDHFKHEIAKAVRAAGLDGLSFHGLRKGFTGALAESGATDAEIEALVPHSAAMTRHYRRQADQATLARAGIEKLSRDTTVSAPGAQNKGKPRN